MSCQLVVKQLNSYASDGGHFVTNEDPRIFSRFLRQNKIKSLSSAASICSGGEIIYLVLLPRADKVIAVDHSLSSILVAMTKAQMLIEIGAREMRRMLRFRHDSDLISLFTSCEKQVRDNNPELAAQKTVEVNIKQAFQNSLTNLSNVWSNCSLKSLEISREKLISGAVTFVHGDIRDICSYGPFDLLYASNARQHKPRDSKELLAQTGFTCLPPTTFCKIVKENGILLETGDLLSDPNWKQISRQNTKCGDTIAPLQTCTWNYFMYKREISR